MFCGTGALESSPTKITVTFFFAPISTSNEGSTSTTGQESAPASYQYKRFIFAGVASTPTKADEERKKEGRKTLLVYADGSRVVLERRIVKLCIRTMQRNANNLYHLLGRLGFNS
jgi:hypothetical protein